MKSGNDKTKRKRSVKRTLLWITGGFFIVVSIVGFLLYNNFNRLLSEALLKSFNSGIISDVYELKFEKLSVNLLMGDIKVSDVVLQPRIKPLRSYPYINSTLSLKTHKILLKNVEIYALLRSGILALERVEITEPDVELNITDDIPIIFPLKDTTEVAGQKNKKKSIESFSLKEFDLVNAAFHVANSAKEREFRIQKLNISLRDMFIDQQPGKDIISYNHFSLSVGGLTGKLQKAALKYISFKDYNLCIDTLKIERSIDSLDFHFADFKTGISALDIQTADSIFHLTMQSFNLSYKEKSIKLEGVSFVPNISEAAMQAKYEYQHAQVSGTVGSISITGINFDSLIYNKKLFIDNVVLGKASIALYKDKTKPVNRNRFPEYLGQTIKAIKLPLLIKQVNGTDVNLANRERNVDSSYAAANINRATIEVKNITNISMDEPLSMKADAYIENKVHFAVSLGFSYTEPEFSMNVKLEKFNLADLNPIIKAYTPAAIKKGVADEISISGNAYRTRANGTMKFLFHDLEIDMELKEKAWKNSVLAFAGNSLVASANPATGEPARIVKFEVERDMNKAFVNIIIKSILNGLKETIIMSKENRKIQKEKKKKMKEEQKK